MGDKSLVLTIVIIFFSFFIFFILYSLFYIAYFDYLHYYYKEGFADTKDVNVKANVKANVKYMILLGDSILKNDNYLKVNELTTENQLSTKFVDFNIIDFAKDGAKIQDGYRQIKEIDTKLNIEFIILSFGGNNLLGNITSNTKDIFNEYLTFIKYLIHMNICDKIYVLNLYHIPVIGTNNNNSTNNNNNKNKVIDIWNEMLYLNEDVGYKVIDICSGFKPSYIVNQIEPGAKGSEFIANQVVAGVELR